LSSLSAAFIAAMIMKLPHHGHRWILVKPDLIVLLLID